MTSEVTIGHALIDAIQGAPLLRSDDEEPRLLVWSGNAPEQLGALALGHANESLRAEIARLRERVTLLEDTLAECEAQRQSFLRSAVKMGGPDNTNNDLSRRIRAALGETK